MKIRHLLLAIALDYERFAHEMHDAIRAEKCEHVWAEVINVRGESMTRTVAALRVGGFEPDAQELLRVTACFAPLL